ncbi:hypothetical protein C8T65DRAFT_306552 [Cerioporus squamosus]|nr:hypothetical protein C8T65DRAFT_306552 [Cerioporus squamosus]
MHSTRLAAILAACLVAGSCTAAAAAVTFRREVDTAHDYIPASLPNRRDADLGGIELCTDVDLSGNCNYRLRPFGECQTLQGDLAFDNEISSVRTDECTACTGYEDYECSVKPILRVFPPNQTVSDGTTGPNTFNDRISSYVCVHQCP